MPTPKEVKIADTAERKAKLRKQVQDSIQDNSIDADIGKFLFLIANNTSGVKSERDAVNELVRDLFAEGFEIHDPLGVFKIGSKVIQQALWRVMSKVKFLDSTIQGTGKDEDTERLVTEGIMTVADRGGLTGCFRDKEGIFLNAGLQGDGLLMFGKGENDENPVSFRVLRNEDVYPDNYCYGIRGTKPANKLATIFQYDKDEAYELWPILEEEGTFGKIPGSVYKTENNQNQDEDIVEICWGYNRAQKKYIIFAGAQCDQIDKFEGEEYPFMKNNKPYIPVFQFMCQPSFGMFWNYGIGLMVYDLAVITRKLLNLETTHLEENVLPVTLINAPQKKLDELVEKMTMANEARARGVKPFVAMEFDANGGQQSVAAQALVTQNLFNEWAAVWDRLYREFSRLGINLDDIERGSGITRGQVLAEEGAGNAFVLQMQEYNASETKELIECVIDATKEFVSNNNKTPLNLKTRLTLPNGKTMKLGKQITMGMLAKELKDGNYFVETDSRSGAIPSDLTKLIYEERQLQMTPPGTPEYNELYRRISMRRGIDMQLKSQAPPPQAAPPMPGGPAIPVPAPVGIEAQPV